MRICLGEYQLVVFFHGLQKVNPLLNIDRFLKRSPFFRSWWVLFFLHFFVGCLKSFKIHHFVGLKRWQWNCLVSHNPSHRPRLQGGINAVANAVKVTLGPKGRNVVLQRESFQALADVDVGSRWDDDVGMDRLDVWGAFKCLDQVHFLGW